MTFIAGQFRAGCASARDIWNMVVAGHRANGGSAVSDDGAVLFETAVLDEAPSASHLKDELASLPGAMLTGVFFSYLTFLPASPTEFLTPEFADAIRASQGGKLSEAFWGNYCGVVFDPKRGTTIAMRDPTGGRPLYHARPQGGEIDLFSDSLTALCNAFKSSLRVDRTMIEMSLAYASGLPTRRTGFEGLASLLPGEAMEVDQRGDTRSWLPWWEALAAGGRAPTDLRRCLDGVASAWSLSSGKVALQLSGGLDSSSLLGVMAGLGKTEQIHGISYFSHHGCTDERHFVAAAAGHVGADLTEIDASGIELTFAMSQLYRFAPRPHGKLFDRQLEDAFDAIASAAGCQTFWLGYGGDTMFVADPRANLMVDALRLAGVRKAALCAFETALYNEHSLWRTIRNAKPATGSLEGFADWAAQARTAWAPPNRGERDFSNEASFGIIERCFTRVELPGERSRIFSVYFDVFSSAEQRHFYTAGGLGYARPLISEPFIAAALAIPAFETVRYGLNRFPQREIVAKVMPREIADRSTKGGADDQLIRAVLASKDGLIELLSNGQLVAQGYIAKEDAVFSEDDILSDKDKYRYIPVLLAAEIWLAGHADLFAELHDAAIVRA